MARSLNTVVVLLCGIFGVCYGTCDDGLYESTAGICDTCQWYHGYVSLGLVLCLESILVILFLKLISNCKTTSIAVNWAFCISLIATVITLFGTVCTIEPWFKVLSLVNFNFQVLGLECDTSYVNYYHYLWMEMLAPGVLLCVLWSYVRTRKQPPIDAGFAVMLTLDAMEFLPMAYITLTYLGCRRDDDDDVWVLNRSPSIVCYDSTYWSWMPLFIFGFLVYIIAVPGEMYWFIVVQRDDRDLETYQRRYGVLSGMYKTKYYYWMLIEMVWKSVIAACAVWIVNYLLMMIAFILMCTGIMYLMVKPFINDAHNYLYCVVCMLSSVLIAGMMVMDMTAGTVLLLCIVVVSVSWYSIVQTRNNNDIDG